jgi:hypothetical protein
VLQGGGVSLSPFTIDVSYDYGNIYFRQPLSSGERLLSARHGAPDLR